MLPPPVAATATGAAPRVLRRFSFGATNSKICPCDIWGTLIATIDVDADLDGDGDVDADLDLVVRSRSA